MAALSPAIPAAERGALLADPGRGGAPPAWVKAAVIFGAWTLVGLFGLLEGMLRGYVGHREALHAAALFQCCWVWAGFTPFIFRLSERFPIERRGWIRALSLHLVFMLAFTLVDVTIDRTLSPWVDPSLKADIPTRFAQELFIDVLNYFAVLSVGHALRFYRLSNQRTLEASRLQGELLRARLTALEMRLRPHFLYNTLHSIAALVRVQRGPEAISMIAGLGDLLRDVLDSDGALEVPLRRELALARRYLAIEQIRFGDRLRVVVNAEEDVLDALVPTLLLQPIVENAVRHGIEADPTPGVIEILARRAGDVLELRVRDDADGRAMLVSSGGSRASSGGGQASGGSGRAHSTLDTHEGIGLGTTRERLRAMFGDRCSVSLVSGARGDVTTTVRMPDPVCAEARA